MIYLDNNSYALLDPEVRRKIDDLLNRPFGNASSQHRYGQLSKALLIESQRKIAKFLDVSPDELVFTSGATEALNMVIHGLTPRGHIITSNLEHPAVLHPLKELKKKGVPITYVEGLVTLEKIEKSLRPDTCTLIFMAVNNETGIKTDIEAIGKFAEKQGLNFIVDGVSLLGKERFSIPKGVSCMCFSSPKIHGPMGVGLVYIRKGVKIDPLILGGPQQRGRRGGTENVSAIYGFESAISLLETYLPEATEKMERLRDRFENGIEKMAPIVIHGKGEKRICNVSNIGFKDIDGELLMMRLDTRGVACSLGAACSSGGIEPSHVLLNMGVAPEIAASSLRFSLSRFTTDEEIDQAIAIVKEEIRPLA